MNGLDESQGTGHRAGGGHFPGAFLHPNSESDGWQLLGQEKDRADLASLIAAISGCRSRRMELLAGCGGGGRGWCRVMVQTPDADVGRQVDDQRHR